MSSSVCIACNRIIGQLKTPASLAAGWGVYVHTILSIGEESMRPGGQHFAMEEQMRFAIREGGKTVGAGVVTKIVA